MTVVNGVQWVDVGPPQTQVTGSCQAQGSDSSPAPPTPRGTNPEPTGDQVHVTFIGAADAQFTQSFPSSGEWVQISMSIYIFRNAQTKTLIGIANPLSISHIQTGTEGVTCVFNGVDNSVTTVIGTQLVDVGPPQTQISGSCAWWVSSEGGQEVAL